MCTTTATTTTAAATTITATEKNSAAVVAVFAKAPLAGQVKTRLAAAVGDERALAIHMQLVEDTVQRLGEVSEAECCLWISEMHLLGPVWAAALRADLQVQQGEDLGARMMHAFAHHFAQGFQQVILVGCDCPMVDAAYVQQAVAALQQQPVVFGPAEDGGYGLIGLNKHHQRLLPELFVQIDWGTDRVMSQSRQRLAQQHIDWCELAQIWDVDEWQDWQRFLNIGVDWQC